MNYRICTKKDIPLMCRMRKQQLIQSGIKPRVNIDDELFRFFSDKLDDGSLVEWLIEKNGEVIATAGILFIEFSPSFSNPTGVRGYITNMYTAPEYRGKGIATSMLRKLIEEAKKRGVFRICLRASEMGRSVYKQFGFNESDRWMDLDL